MNKHILVFITLLVFGFATAHAQSQFYAKIIDSSTQKPVPFATVAFNHTSGVISNEHGDFQLQINTPLKNTDSLFFSCLGYAPKTIQALSFTDSLLTLIPKSIALNEVMVFSKNYSVEDIIDKVKSHIETNYKTDYSKSKLFFRESYYTDILKKDVTIKKTTIPEFNQQFTDSVLYDLPSQSANYTEILADFYRANPEESETKLDITKASELYDKANEITFEAYEEKFNSIIRKHVKLDSYFKIKSGWFGTKSDMDSTIFNTSENEKTEAYLEAQKQKEIDRKENFLKYRKQEINNIAHYNIINENSAINVLFKSGRYHFKLLDYYFINEQYVYRISFTPKRSEDFKGFLYVNTEDFAIIRLEYENVKPLKTFNLLGLSFKEYLKKGTIMYSKNDTNKYYIKYAETHYANKAGIDRPIKIIEKNKHVSGRRKQNEVAADLNFIVNSRIKKELVVFENEAITEASFNTFEEKAQIKPVYLPHYDPEFWKGYNIIEPNEAIKTFKSIDATEE